MSYNISDCKVYELDLSMSEDEMGDFLSSWDIGEYYVETSVHNWELDITEGEIKGHWTGGRFIFDELCPYGTSSGHMWEAIKDMLNRTKGIYRARITWEDGDSVQKIVVRDGRIKEQELTAW